MKVESVTKFPTSVKTSTKNAIKAVNNMTFNANLANESSYNAGREALKRSLKVFLPACIALLPITSLMCNNSNNSKLNPVEEKLAEKLHEIIEKLPSEKTYAIFREASPINTKEQIEKVIKETQLIDNFCKNNRTFMDIRA